MQSRVNFAKAAPDAYKAVAALDSYVKGSGIEPRLIHLIKLRASQINGCAYCVDMHTKEARHSGLSQQGSTSSVSGANRRISMSANGRSSAGPRR